jgi:predicted ATPase
VKSAAIRASDLPSVLWAGPEQTERAVREGCCPVQGTVHRGSVALRLGFGAEDFSYAIDLGPPPPAKTAFGRDPVIKREAVWTGPVLRPAAVLCDRLGSFVRIRDEAGGWSAPTPIREYDSMLSEFADPQRAPELLGLRDRIRSWRSTTSSAPTQPRLPGAVRSAPARLC